MIALGFTLGFPMNSIGLLYVSPHKGANVLTLPMHYLIVSIIAMFGRVLPNIHMGSQFPYRSLMNCLHFHARVDYITTYRYPPLPLA